MMDVRTLGTLLEDVLCDECDETDDLAVYTHPHTHLRVILCPPHAEVVFKDELAEMDPPRTRAEAWED